MTPIALRVQDKVRQKDHGTYEGWFQAIVDETVDDVAGIVMAFPVRVNQGDGIQWPRPAAIAIGILSLKESEQEPCE